MDHKKKFIIIGNKNAITYKEIFPLLKNNEMWLGDNNPAPQEFLTPQGVTKSVNGLTRWYTNLDIKKRHEDLILVKRYTPEAYPHYDNYDAIEVSKVADIPCDYAGVMGTPVTVLDKYSKEQFQIVGMAAGNTRATGFYFDVPYKPHPEDRGGCGVVNGKRVYARILIRNKHPEAPKEV